jgi:hypothetical protein
MVRKNKFTAIAVFFIIVLMNTVVISIVVGDKQSDDFNQPSFCKEIDLKNQISQGSDFTSKFGSLLSTFTLTHRSRVTSVFGDRISYYSESTTTPLTIMPYMGVQSAIYYSSDQINWGSPLKQTIVTRTNTPSVRASSYWIASTPGFYLIQGCHQGSYPWGESYHVDTYTIVRID